MVNSVEPNKSVSLDSPGLISPKMSFFSTVLPFAVTSTITIARPAQIQVTPSGHRESSKTSVNFILTPLRTTDLFKGTLTAIFGGFDSPFWPKAKLEKRMSKDRIGYFILRFFPILKVQKYVSILIEISPNPGTRKNPLSSNRFFRVCFQ